MQHQHVVTQAELHEVKEIIKFGEDFFPDKNFDKSQVASYLQVLISNQKSVFISRNTSQKITGVLLALSNGVDWRTGDRVVVEQGVYILDGAERMDICKALYKGLYEWALSLRAYKIVAEAGTLNRSVISEADYQKIGFKTIGQIMEREVNQYV